jgi:integrase
MAILAECPMCHRKQQVRKELCSSCGENLKKAGKAGKVRYYIVYYLPGGKRKQKKEFVSMSLSEARDAEGKRRSQRRENRIFDIKPDSKTTFKELSDWYLSLEVVQSLASFKTLVVYLGKFNGQFGNVIVSNIKTSALENLQEKRRKQGLALKTIDHEIQAAKTVVWKGFRDGLVSGDVLRTFQNVKKLLKGHSNRRERVLTPAEFDGLLRVAPRHLQGILSAGYWTGMRKGEVINLTWDKVDLNARVINLTAADTKDREARSIPIGGELHKSLLKIPRPVHDSHVFLYNGKPVLKRFETAMKSACKDAGIIWGKKEKDGFIFHDLRHSFVTDMRRAGVMRSVVNSITGHAITDMNERYDTVNDEDRQEAISRLEDYRKSIAQGIAQNAVSV